MKKITLLLIICLLFCGFARAQKISLSLNGNYRTEIDDFGLGAQLMTPLSRYFYIAPSMTYFYGKSFELNTPYIKSKSDEKSFNFGADVHYAIRLGNSGTFVSPFIGVEGMVIWGDYKTSVIDFNRNWIGYSNDDSHFYVLGNIGVAGKWFVSRNVFINTQVKYSIIFHEGGGNYFVFTTGIGYLF